MLIGRRGMESDEEDARDGTVLKIVVCGDGASGKTSLCIRVAQDNFTRQYQQASNKFIFYQIFFFPFILIYLAKSFSTYKTLINYQTITK